VRVLPARTRYFFGAIASPASPNGAVGPRGWCAASTTTR